jgi:high affinity Mn2+ porin
MGATVRVVVGAVVVGALTLGGHAHATEPLLPLNAPPLAASNFDWNGFYVGGHMGYAWGRSGWTGETPDTPLLGGSLGFYEPWNGWTGAGSYFAGLQAGYNTILPSRLMLGGEVDTSFPSTIGGAQPIETATLGTATYGEGVLSSGTVRGRIGYAFDNWLPYVTGGFAWTFNEAVVLSPGTPITDLDDFFPLEHRLFWRLGWTIGAGVEFPFAPNWTAKAEYLFTDYGARSVLLPASDLGIESNFSLSELRFGLNYHLPATTAEVSNLTAAAIRPDLTDFAVHAQTTFISQYGAPFRSPYQGTNSLPPNQGRESWDVTLYAGWQPWRGAEVWFNPESDQGFALNDVHGVAGFPNADPGPGFSYPFVRVQRLFFRQTIDLGPATDKVAADLNQFAMTQSTDRLVITAGKFSVGDVFDLNQYATDVRTDFMNMAVVGTATFDNAQDAWGYTYGVAAEWYQGPWTLRAGYFDLSRLPGRIALDPTWGEVQYVGEVERRYAVWGQPGKVLVTGFLSHAQMARYNEVVSLSELTGESAADVIPFVRRYTNRSGVSMNFEQQITPDLGIFGRAGIANPNVEDYEVTDVDRTAVLGLSQSGNPWGRRDDTFGLAGVVDNISSAHQAFFNAGGLGIIVGDGILPHPGLEQILETYYKYTVSSLLWVTLDYQFVKNPGYNRDRGPASVGAIRLHAEF